jgi:hypothetical protein
MPKVKCSDGVKLRGLVQEFREQHFNTATVVWRVSHTTIAAIFDNAMKLLSKGEVE